jgi:hypothetical protein
MCDVLIFPRGLHSKLHVVQDNGSIAEQYGQRALVQMPGLIPKHLGTGRQQSMQYHEIKNENKEALDNVRIPEMLGLSIEGDGETEGVNTFLYRFFSSEQISNLIIGGFESLNDRLEQNRIPDADQDEMEIFQRVGSTQLEHGIRNCLPRGISRQHPEHWIYISESMLHASLHILSGKKLAITNGYT